MKDNPTARPTSLAQIVPVMFCFFAMGFVDLVGTAKNYLQDDLQLSDSVANIFPSLVFFWFLIFSLPTSMLMNRIGRKNTVLVSLIITLVSLVIPIFSSSFAAMLVSFSLLGIGNAVMQTSLNPLVSNLISPDRLASTLTLGQFVKAIASFVAPLICSWGIALAASSADFGLSWRILFPIFAAVSILSVAILGATPISEEKPEKPAGFVDTVKLLRIPFVLLCFLGIMCHVGIDVGTNATAPRILQDSHPEIPTATATFATMVYFICRTAGCFLGSFVLRVMRPKLFFIISAAMMLAAMIGMFTMHSVTAVYVCVGMVGLGNSNIFSIIFAQALNHVPDNKNEVSGLMIMGLFGGTVFPLVMGFATDLIGSQAGAVAVMTVGVAYLLMLSPRLKKA